MATISSQRCCSPYPTRTLSRGTWIVIRQDVILQVTVGHKSAADVKGAGCGDEVEEESLDEGVGFRG